jgi:hypothetical protein
MSLVINTERAIIKRMCGKPDTVEVGDDDIEAILRHESLRWLNERRPGVALTFFTTVPDQQDYTVKPATAYKIRDVWWLTGEVEVFSPSLSYVPSTMTSINAFGDFDVFDNPSIVTEFYKRLSEYEYTFKGHGYELPNGQVRLEPVPGGTDNVYFEYTYPRWTDITSVPDEWREAVRYYAASEVMRMLFIRRGVISGGKEWSGGGGANEKEVLTEYLAKAESLTPDISSPFYRG